MSKNGFSIDLAGNQRVHSVGNLLPIAAPANTGVEPPLCHQCQKVAEILTKAGADAENLDPSPCSPAAIW